MTDDRVPEDGPSSIPPEPVASQLSAPSSNDKSNNEHTEELIEMYENIPVMYRPVSVLGLTLLSSPPTTTSPTSVIPITVGPEEQVFEVSEHILKKIPCFTTIFQTRTFLEGAEGRLRLPEDYPLVFDKMLHFLHTGDYLPHIVPSLEPCDEEHYKTLFQYKQRLECRTRHECERRYEASCCGSLEGTLEVIVNLDENTAAPYHHGDPQFGRWKTADATHGLFEREVLLFCLAERFMMDDLKKLCLRKIHMFPLGPRELAVLAEHVPAKVYEPTGDHQINNELHQLLQQCIHYHQRYFDEWRSQTWFWNLSENACDYADYLKVIESQMTAHGAMLFHAMTGARHSIEESVGIAHNGWECSYERIGVCRSDYTELVARNDFGRSASRAGEDEESEATTTHTPTAPALEVHAPENFYPGFEFCEAHAGDTIMHLTLNQPWKGLVYGLNVRADRWSWYPRKLLRFLETKSYRDCSCHNCEPPTFKVNGRGPWLYMHDPESKGLAYRPGTRQTDLDRERRDRGR